MENEYNSLLLLVSQIGAHTSKSLFLFFIFLGCLFVLFGFFHIQVKIPMTVNLKVKNMHTPTNTRKLDSVSFSEEKVQQIIEVTFYFGCRGRDENRTTETEKKTICNCTHSGDPPKTE